MQNDINKNDIIQYLNYLEKEKLEGANVKAGDVNYDGKADFQDILQINKYRLSKIKSL